MKFWLLFLCCYIFVVRLDSYILDQNAIKRIRSAGKKERSRV